MSLSGFLILVVDSFDSLLSRITAFSSTLKKGCSSLTFLPVIFSQYLESRCIDFKEAAPYISQTNARENKAKISPKIKYLKVTGKLKIELNAPYFTHGLGQPQLTISRRM